MLCVRSSFFHGFRGHYNAWDSKGERRGSVPLKPGQKRAVRKSIWRLAILAIVLGLALYFNKPLSKEVTFDIACQGFVAPAPLPLNLHYSPTDIRGVTANGFGGAVRNAARVTFAQEGEAPRPVAARGFTLARTRDPNQTPPYLEVKPEGAAGKVALSVDAGVTLRSTGSPGETPAVAVESARQGDVRLLLGTDSVALNGNRYAIPELNSGALVKSFRAAATGEFLVEVELTSEAPPPVDPDSRSPARSWMKISLEPDPGQLPLLPESGRKHDEIRLNSGSGPIDLIFTGAVHPDLRLKATSVPGVIADRNVDLRIEADSGSIEAISINGSPDRRNAPTLNVKGSARTRSVRQDGHELLPTVVEEALSESYTTRGPVLIILGFAAFAVFKIVDRVFGVLLEVYLPKGDE